MRFTVATSVVLAFGLVHAVAADAAGGVVGTGTPASCTQASFDTVFFRAQTTGGGIITFNCGAAPHVVVLGVLKPVSAPTEIAGGDRITLSGGFTAGVFEVNTGSSLKLSNIVITRGYGTLGAISNFGKLTIVDSRLEANVSTTNGGAINNYGDATLENVVVSDNTAVQWGGGIYADAGTLRIIGSDIVGNAGANGGGLYVATGGAATIELTKFRINQTNVTTGQGGGIYSTGTLNVTDTTFAQNRANLLGGALATRGGAATVVRSVMIRNLALAGAAIVHTAGSLAINQTNIVANGVDEAGTRIATAGGGLLHDVGGTVVMTNVSIVGNQATSGGGIANFAGAITLTNVTMRSNRGQDGAALRILAGTAALTNVSILENNADTLGSILERTGGTLTLRNTALSNPGNSNCAQPLIGATFSLSSDASCGFGAGRDNVAMQFRDVEFNDGFTLTQVPFAGNPVIDSGTSVGCPATDQRGVARPSGLACDIGAVEFVANAPVTATVVEYFNASFGHYFVSLLLAEIFQLDAGTFVGWTRTGQQFKVVRENMSGLAAVCRFFTTAFPPKSSHFYAPRDFGCEGTLQNNDWQFEGDVFFTALPSGSGACPVGHLPVFRLYNNGQGGAPNHRFTTSATVRTQMLARGYVAEGAGIGVGMCSPP